MEGDRWTVFDVFNVFYIGQNEHVTSHSYASVSQKYLSWMQKSEE